MNSVGFEILLNNRQIQIGVNLKHFLPTKDIQYFSVRMDLVNRVDFFSEFTCLQNLQHIAKMILAMLDPDSLVQARAVSVVWRDCVDFGSPLWRQISPEKYHKVWISSMRNKDISWQFVTTILIWYYLLWGYRAKNIRGLILNRIRLPEGILACKFPTKH